MTITINGSYQDPNYLTGFMLFAIVYYLERFIRHRSIVSLCTMSAFICVVLLTGSRGGLLAVVVAMLTYGILWLRSNKNRLSSTLTVCLALSAIVLVFFLFLDVVPEEVARRFDVSFTLADRAAGRTDIWRNILYSYAESPPLNKLFGWGAGTVRNFNHRSAVAHNVWIESLVELGIVGTLILVMLYMAYLKKSYATNDLVVSASLVGYTVMTMSMSLYSYKPIWNILLLIRIIVSFNKAVSRSRASSISTQW